MSDGTHGEDPHRLASSQARRPEPPCAPRRERYALNIGADVSLSPAVPASSPHDGRALCELSRRIVGSTRRQTGRGPTACRTSWAGPDTIVSVLGEWMTRSEHTLVQAGHAVDVIAARRTLDEALESELSAEVQTLFGRPVAAVLSARGCATDVASHVFVLAPGASPPAR